VIATCGGVSGSADRWKVEGVHHVLVDVQRDVRSCGGRGGGEAAGVVQQRLVTAGHDEQGRQVRQVPVQG
jgi:hypothetical protein